MLCPSPSSSIKTSKPLARTAVGSASIGYCIGAGPAGLSAAIYAARAKYRVLVLEKNGIGGQITITSEIVNYPGVEMAGGKELTEHMRVQAERLLTNLLAQLQL